jgi:phosphatidylinositol-3-phosphatase
MSLTRRIRHISGAALLSAALGAIAAAPPRPYDHIVIVVLENSSAEAGGTRRIRGNPAMPFINGLADDPQHGARFANAWAAETPYRRIPACFDKPLPAQRRPFTTANLGAALRAAGKPFLSFSESLPHLFWDAEGDPEPERDSYRRKHNPTINWVDFGAPTTLRPVPAERRRFLLPPGINLAFRASVDPSGRRWRGFAEDAQGKPLGFQHLPTVSLVVPDEQHDAHSASVGAADSWLRDNIGPYADWAIRHNGLLIVTFDEDGATDTSQGNAYHFGSDRISTLFYGADVRPGAYLERIDALNVLATVLHNQGLLARFRDDFAQTCPDDTATCVRQLANLRPIVDVFGRGPALSAIPPVRD